jgi:rare lipoprotein A
MKEITIIFLLSLNFPVIKGQADPANIIKGIASYYSGKFEGKRCASGEIFRQENLTAAHKTLKFGTKIKVINLQNDSSVIVKVNDRLPSRSKCCVDLNLSAAKQLNFVISGLAKVKIEILKDSLP